MEYKRQARIVYTNDEGKTFKAVKSLDWNSEFGTPVGIELIPASHDVYGNGKACILALKDANGGKGIKWQEKGKSYQNISTLKNFDETPKIEQGKNEVNKNSDYYSFLSSSKDFGNYNITNPLDDDTQWHIDSSKRYTPSPYNLDETRNSSYYQTTAPMSSRNACSDFDGKGNTDKIIAFYGEDGENYAARVARKTDENGLDWYLPSAGELGYLAARFNEINDALRMICGAHLVGNSLSYWSSTEINNRYAWKLYTGNMDLHNYNDKNYVYRVRSITKVIIK